MNNTAVLQALQGVKLDESLKLVNRAMEITGPQGWISIRAAPSTSP